MIASLCSSPSLNVRPVTRALDDSERGVAVGAPDVSAVDDPEREGEPGGSAAQGFGAQIMSKTVYVLEEVSEGLAYFSIKQRSVSKTSGAMGTAADTKSAGKGEAIFDLKEGMWLEFTTKSRHNVSMGNIPGAGTAPGNNTVLAVNKITMEKQ